MLKSEGISVEDIFIVQQVKSGHTQAFRILVLRYQKPLFRYLQSFGLRKTLVEEIAQESFLRAYKNISSFDEKQARFSTWLFVIAKNLGLNEIGRHSYMKEEIPEHLPEITEGETPFSQLEKKQLAEKFDTLLAALPVVFRNALVLFHHNEMSLEEISQIENCSLGTVKSRLFRAKELLKLALKNNMEEL